MKTEYLVIKESTIDRLESDVNRLLNNRVKAGDGDSAWELQGGVGACYNPHTGKVVLFQALVRKVSSKNFGDSE